MHPTPDSFYRALGGNVWRTSGEDYTFGSGSLRHAESARKTVREDIKE